MRSRESLSAAGVAGSVAAALFLLTSTAGTALGQQSSPPRVTRREPFAGMRERQQREAQLRGAEMRPRESKDGRGLEAAVEQVREDFKRIQILRNELVRNLKAGGPLDYAAISDKAGEINKRAGRLKAYLVPVNPEGDEEGQKNQVEFNGGQMTDALVTLCKRIESFVENPVFKVPEVVDVEQSAKAGGDLQRIIQLSAGIKKGAERLSKTHK